MTLDRTDIEAIAEEVIRQLAPALSAKVPPVKCAPIPLALREAAEFCHVELNWLRERVAWKDIPAYRSGRNASWRVFPEDVRTYLMSETNMKPVRRKSVLRNVNP